jgi:GntR family transcriptional regulator, transcriptional repressor for pyruvate dehydrogenase complex
MSVTHAPKRRAGSAVLRAAEALREEVLARASGEIIGSESELVERLNVSRPTFRQAARLIEQEQLLTIKRGVGGGFFARRPGSAAVAHLTRIFLRTRNATAADALAAALPLFGQIARAAATRADPKTRSSLARLISQERLLDSNLESLQRSEREFLRIFAASAGNPVLELCATVLMNFVGSVIEPGISLPRLEHISVYREIRQGLVRAILSGDPEVAQIMALRWSQSLAQWMEADVPPRKRERSASRRRAGFGIPGRWPATAMG